MFDMGGSMVKKFLSSPEGQQMIKEYIASPEGMNTIKEFMGSAEGKKIGADILLSMIDQFQIPDEAKGMIKQALEGL
jgi:hypothetical protein